MQILSIFIQTPPLPIFSPFAGDTYRRVKACQTVVLTAAAIPYIFEIFQHGLQLGARLPDDSASLGRAVMLPPTAQAGKAACLDF